MTANARGFALGMIGIAAMAACSLIAVQLNIPGGDILLWVSFIAGGFITAHVASSQKLLLSTALALPGVAIVALLVWAWLAVGLPGDDIGLGGRFIVAVISLPLCAGLCCGGGSIRLLLGRWMTPNNSLERTHER